jgi:hypothetical protein
MMSFVEPYVGKGRNVTMHFNVIGKQVAGHHHEQSKTVASSLCTKQATCTACAFHNGIRETIKRKPKSIMHYNQTEVLSVKQVQFMKIV